MGRMDVMMYDIDTTGEVVGWIVADLKTGRPPTDGVYDTVSRQLRLYRDLLSENNPGHPPITSEAWYSDGSKVFTARGDSVLEEAFAAWDAMYPTPEPPPATPSNDACGFCEWKAWCPAWFHARSEGGLSAPTGIFRDEVALVLQFDEASGACMVELVSPKDEVGGIIPSGRTIGLICKGQALDQMRDVMNSDHRGAVFLGSIRTNAKPWAMGDWSEVLPWAPLHESIRNSSYRNKSEEE